MVPVGVPGVPNHHGRNLSTADRIETSNPHRTGTGHDHPENKAPEMPDGQAVEEWGMTTSHIHSAGTALEADTWPRSRSRFKAAAFLAWITISVVAALLVAGCGDQGNGRSAAPKPSASMPSTSRTVPTTTTAATTAQGPLTAQDLLWLQTAEMLLARMNKAFTDSPSDLTPSALKSLANEVRGCSRELARIGSSSSRLQPVDALVKQGCQEYDKGSTCFADGARIGIPSSSAAVRELEQKINCGFASSGKGGLRLTEAQVKAAEIKAEIG
jgi:hypothetical protein